MRRPVRGAAGLLALAVATAALGAGGTPASGTATAGSAGTDTSLPATDSAVSVRGRGSFAGLEVTVNQTADLTNQALSVTWKGATPSNGFAGDWLQLFQCWGDDDGTVPDNPGPPPEQCEFGGEPIGTSVTGKIPAAANPSDTYTRRVAQDNWSSFDPATRRCGSGPAAVTDCYDPAVGSVWKPFKAVDGTIVEAQARLRPTTDSSQVSVTWENTFFDFTTTNEDPWGRTYGNGTGASLFEVDTGYEAPGLGCGQRVEHRPDGTTAIPRCWLVAVPRGTPAAENPSGLDDFHYVVTSPLSATAWRNRIAVPLTFNPLEVACSLGADQRRVVGSELAGAAVVNWQPALCATPGLPPYAYQAVGDDSARRQLLSGASGAPGMGVFSHPVEAPADPDAPLVYAPLTLSGVVIGFNVERVPYAYDGTVKDPDQLPIGGTRVARLNLTPRLVAKLLTQSYTAQLFQLPVASPPAGYGWVSGNPDQLFADPDFVRFNPEFADISVGSKRTAAAAMTEARTADAAAELWRWVLADPEARTWLGGTPDEWGMRVNPYFSTDPAANRSGAAFADPAPDRFPRNDPYCYQSPPIPGREVTPRPLCSLDTSPFATTMEAAARAVRTANDGAMTAHSADDPTKQTATTWWSAEGPERLGSRSILAVTDSASAARYGLQTASLSRAGDDGRSRTFVAPDQDGLLAGEQAMVDTPTAGVRKPDPSTTAAGAYPLTLVNYAAVSPAGLDAGAKADYASLLEYAAGPGQQPGTHFGDLPAGFAPLPAGLCLQTAAAARTIRAFTAPHTGDGDAGSDSTTAVPASAPLGQHAPAGSPAAATGAAATGAAPAGPGAAGAGPGDSPAAPTMRTEAAGADRPAGRRGTTPWSHLGVLRFAVPLAGAVFLVAVLGVLFLDDRWFRRAGGPAPAQPNRPST